ncbi:hypothetical protein IscW_ISCW006676 [Ixodes scapularis]|uniref:Uncharacterized protein n=1 Tax=Ixodes scapularis TaxID=6945 RepID=B7PPF2_IXOSC|nr:hypothetical protein IscW_ISCW006676 [Ixodes scapularis]|eukprot:XP_002435644.1 hypothetical protein IscW_ISCW006676 [Ixodes scapularis]
MSPNNANARAIKRPAAAFSHRSRPWIRWELQCERKILCISPIRPARPPHPNTARCATTMWLPSLWTTAPACARPASPAMTLPAPCSRPSWAAPGISEWAFQ